MAKVKNSVKKRHKCCMCGAVRFEENMVQVSTKQWSAMRGNWIPTYFGNADKDHWVCLYGYSRWRSCVDGKVRAKRDGGKIIIAMSPQDEIS